MSDDERLNQILDRAQERGIPLRVRIGEDDRTDTKLRMGKSAYLELNRINRILSIVDGRDPEDVDETIPERLLLVLQQLGVQGLPTPEEVEEWWQPT